MHRSFSILALIYDFPKSIKCRFPPLVVKRIVFARYNEVERKQRRRFLGARGALNCVAQHSTPLRLNVSADIDSGLNRACLALAAATAADSFAPGLRRQLAVE